MKIDSTGRPIGPKSVRPKEKSQKSKSGDFSKALTDQVATSGPVGGTTPISPVDAVLAAQEVGDSTSERRKACFQFCLENPRPFKIYFFLCDKRHC